MIEKEHLKNNIKNQNDIVKLRNPYGEKGGWHTALL